MNTVLTLSSVFLSAFLSFSSLTACLSASFFSVSSMATARCSPRSRSSTAARSVWADWAPRWASARLAERWRRAWPREDRDHIQTHDSKTAEVTMTILMYKIFCTGILSSAASQMSCGMNFLPHLLSFVELSLQVFSPQLALVQLTLQALHTLSEGGHILLPLHQWGPGFIQSFLIGTKTIITSLFSFHPRCPFSLLCHSPAEAFCHVRPHSVSSAERPADSLCCSEKLPPLRGSFWVKTSSLWAKIHLLVLWAEPGSASPPLSGAEMLWPLLLPPVVCTDQIYEWPSQQTEKKHCFLYWTGSGESAVSYL